jgi:hypothetical protein
MAEFYLRVRLSPLLAFLFVCEEFFPRLLLATDNKKHATVNVAHVRKKALGSKAHRFKG